MVTLKGKKKKEKDGNHVCDDSQSVAWMTECSMLEIMCKHSQGLVSPRQTAIVWWEVASHQVTRALLLKVWSTLNHWTTSWSGHLHYPVIKREKNLLQLLIYPKFLPCFYSATRKRRHSVKHCCNKLFSAFQFSALSSQVWTTKTINQCKPARYTWATKPGSECVCMPPLCSIHNSS